MMANHTAHNLYLQHKRQEQELRNELAKLPNTNHSRGQAIDLMQTDPNNPWGFGETDFPKEEPKVTTPLGPDPILELDMPEATFGEQMGHRATRNAAEALLLILDEFQQSGQVVVVIGQTKVLLTADMLPSVMGRKTGDPLLPIMTVKVAENEYRRASNLGEMLRESAPSVRSARQIGKTLAQQALITKNNQVTQQMYPAPSGAQSLTPNQISWRDPASLPPTPLS